MINKKSGVFRDLTDSHQIMRDLETAAEAGNKKAILALKMYAYKVKKFNSSYMAVNERADLLVFTGESAKMISYEEDDLFRHGKPWNFSLTMRP